MLLRSVWRAAAAVTAWAPAATFADDANPPGQSTFVSPDNDVAFAFTVPENKDFKYPDATFFSIRVPTKYSWGAVGLGSDDMKGALYLMIYRNEAGNNVTFSPRMAYDNSEPTYWSEMEYTIIPNNTGVFDDYMYFTAMCTAHCRSWNRKDTNGGWIDVSSPNQKAIYAVGPVGTLMSNKQDAALRFHHAYGVFSIDMGRTQGAADAPVLNKDSKNEGTELVWRETDKWDSKVMLHAVFMISFLIGMTNFGIALLRICGWAKMHALNQIISTLGVLSGLALGVLSSFHYNRSRGFKHHHQILGYIIVAFILAQLGLGAKQHMEYQKRQAPTIFSSIHVWTGRVILFLGILDCVTGFVFAQRRQHAIVLAGLVIVTAGCSLIYMYSQKNVFRRKQQFQPVGAQQPPPWRQTGHGSGYPLDGSPGYELPSQQRASQPAGSSSDLNTPWRSADSKDHDEEAHLGSAQKPREFA